jgi:hypothetical protein
MTAPSASTTHDAGPDDPGLTPESTSAGTLRLDRAGIGKATADEVEVRLGGIGALQAEDVFVQWGGIGATRADTVGVEFGAVGAAFAGEVRVTQGFAGSILAREATLEQAVARNVIAQRVTINRPSAIGILIAQHVHGDVRPLIDWRGALAAGAVIGLGAAIGIVVRTGEREARRRNLGPIRRR